MNTHAHIITLDDRNKQDVIILDAVRKIATGEYHVHRNPPRREREKHTNAEYLATHNENVAAIFPGNLGGGDRPDA